MIYTFTFNLVGICGPGGFMHGSCDEVLDFARPLAKVALDHLGDWVPATEWFTTFEEPADIYQLLQHEDQEEAIWAISQISDLLLEQKYGHLSICEFNGLFEAVEHHDILSWCSPTLKKKIVDLQTAKESLVAEIAEEWADVF